MASSPSPFSNNSGKLAPGTLVFAQSINNNFTINNIGNATQNIRPATHQNGTLLHQSNSSGMMSTPTSIVRLNQPLSTPTQFVPQTIWTTNGTPSSPRLQYASTVKQEPVNRIVGQNVVRQTAPSQPTSKFTESQIRDFVAKCRTFLITLLKLAEKQAPEKLPMVRSCIQDLLNGTIDPESFTQRLHTLYKSQPHTSLVPFFKLALPHMRQLVESTFKQPISIELLERLNLPSGSSATTTSSVIVNPSLLSQQSTSGGQQSLLYTTVQPQQKINLLQQTPQQSFISSTPSLLGQQQQLQQQARAQISITGIRPIITGVSPSSNTNLLTGQQHIQPVTQTIIPQSDSMLQRTNALQQPQIITVNHQSIRTEIITNQRPSLTTVSSLQTAQKFPNQQKTILSRADDHASDDPSDNAGLLTSTVTDDRHARHIANDGRLLPAAVLRRRLDHLVKKDSRWEGGPLTVHDDSVVAMISHATEQRLKCLIEKIKSISKKRVDLAANERALGERPDQPFPIDRVPTKRKLNDNDDVDAPSSKSTKRTIRSDLRDVIYVMERDKSLRRSRLLFKALDPAL